MSSDMNLFLQRTSFNMNKTIIDEIGKEKENKVDQFNATSGSMIKTVVDGVNTGSSDRLIHSISMIKDILLSNM